MSDDICKVHGLVIVSFKDVCGAV